MSFWLFNAFRENDMRNNSPFSFPILLWAYVMHWHLINNQSRTQQCFDLYLFNLRMRYFQMLIMKLWGEDDISESSSSPSLSLSLSLTSSVTVEHEVGSWASVGLNLWVSEIFSFSCLVHCYLVVFIVRSGHLLPLFLRVACNELAQITDEIYLIKS